MLALYLVSLGATNSRKSKIRNDKAINSPQANKERTFHVHMFVESLGIVVQYIHFRTVLQIQPCS